MFTIILRYATMNVYQSYYNSVHQAVFSHRSTAFFIEEAEIFLLPLNYKADNGNIIIQDIILCIYLSRFPLGAWQEDRYGRRCLLIGCVPEKIIRDARRLSLLI